MPKYDPSAESDLDVFLRTIVTWPLALKKVRTYEFHRRTMRLETGAGVGTWPTLSSPRP